MKKDKFGMVLVIALFAYFLILMDNSIVFTSSVEIGQALNLSETALAWVSNAYTLTFGSFLLLSGKLLDLFGRKKVFMIGLTIFGLASLVIGLTNNSGLLIAARAIQGIGSSIVAPTTLALIMDEYEGKMRAKAISYYGAMAGVGSTFGLVLGGALTSYLSWRAGFLVNVPFTLILLILTGRYVKKSDGHAIKVDYVGALISVLGLTSLIYALSVNNNPIFMITGIILLIIFIFFEKKQANPVLPLSLFANKNRLAGYLARLFFMMAMLPYWFLLPQYMHAKYGFSAIENGLAFLPVTIFTFLTSFTLPRLNEKFSHTQIAISGSIVLTIGLFLTAILNLKYGYWLSVAFPMVLSGAGQGLIMAPLTSLGIEDAPQEVAGSASGLTNTMHQLGGPIGLSILVAQGANFQFNLGMMGIFIVIAILILMFLTKKVD
ncbi:MFS transporter [Lactobacillus jensenii]|uniref:MFS transporter n=1 Tax=Lactobacillus jensenii TaxID=109790 RepID=UPI001419D37C|nr:MFS transporter [Lactobacillus jensenii]NIB69121.1 MFS transporter [Lactobacillus jensenii]NIB70739.1 MFS transporter [Lactobacillus jensenii]